MPIQFVFSVASTIGVVAQLGEHLPCTQGVGSSILPGSTKKQHARCYRRKQHYDVVLACKIRMFIKKMVRMCVHKHKASLRIFEMTEFIWSRRKAQTVDALAVRGEEGRGILRKA